MGRLLNNIVFSLFLPPEFEVMIQTWFECKIKYQKMDNDGRERVVTENFLLDAVSFTDAEARITAAMQTMVRG